MTLQQLETSLSEVILFLKPWARVKGKLLQLILSTFMHSLSLSISIPLSSPSLPCPLPYPPFLLPFFSSCTLIPSVVYLFTLETIAFKMFL